MIGLPAAGRWQRVAKMVGAAAGLALALAAACLFLPAVQAQLTERNGWGRGLALLAAGCAVGIASLLRRAPLPWPLTVLGAILLGLGVVSELDVIQRGPSVEGPPPIAWETSLDAGLATAKQQHRPVAVDFTADWCAGCQQLEKQTYVDMHVRRAMLRFLPIKVDCTQMDDQTSALLARYGVSGLPAMVFLDSAGEVLAKPRLLGFVGPSRLLDMLAQVK